MSYNHERLFEVAQNTFLTHPMASLSDVARQLQIDRHTLRAVIEEKTGKGFRSWRNAIILEELDRLLNRPELSIKQIAHGLGYRSPQAFARFFKKVHKCSPSDYREVWLNSHPKSDQK